MNLRIPSALILTLAGCPDDTAATESGSTDSSGSTPSETGDTPTEATPTEALDCNEPEIDLEEPAEAGQWSSLINWSDIGTLLSCEMCDEGPGFIATHAVHLPTGHILFWDGKAGMSALADQYLYSLADGTFEYVPANYTRTACAFDNSVGCAVDLDCEAYCANVDENNENCAGTPDLTCEVASEPGDLFCSGHTHGVDGNVTVAGGNITGNAFGWGSHELLSFDQSLHTWDLLDTHLTAYRWYPSVIQLGDGRIMVHGGDLLTNSVEIFDPEAGSVLQLSAHPTDTNGNRTGFIQYPLIFQMPSGLAFYAGGEGFGGKLKNGYMLSLDPNLFGWVNLPLPSAIPGGSGVMYEPGKVMKSGGCDDVGGNRCLAYDGTETISSSLNEFDLS